jgi:hypothetical protein
MPEALTDVDEAAGESGSSSAAPTAARQATQLTPQQQASQDIGLAKAGTSLYGDVTGDSSLSGLSGALGVGGAALGAYNLAENWQSGATGPDALMGAEEGASIGSAVMPGIGTAVGGVLGGAVGAISSAFGGGKPDPETLMGQNYTAQYNSLNPQQQGQLASQMSPAQNFQFLAGIFDAKNNSPGHSTPLEQIFGQRGEGNFVLQMTGQINSAIKSGKLSPNASAEQIYSQVVTPWLSSYQGNYGGGNTSAAIQANWTNSQGQPFGNALASSIVNLIGQWQSGALTAQTPIGISGQQLTGLEAYAGGAGTAGTAGTAYSSMAPTAQGAAPPAGSTGTSGYAYSSLAPVSFNYGGPGVSFGYG